MEIELIKQPFAIGLLVRQEFCCQMGRKCGKRA